MFFCFVLFCLWGSGHWVHLVGIKSEKQIKNEKRSVCVCVCVSVVCFISFQWSEEFLAHLIPMVSKLSWMKTNLPAKSYGCNIDQIKEVVKELVGGWVKGRWRISHRFLLQRIGGVRAGAAAGRGGRRTWRLRGVDFTAAHQHARVCAWRVSDQVIAKPRKTCLRERNRSVYFAKACCQHALFLFLLFNVFLFPILVLFSSFFLSFLPSFQ